MTGSGLMRLEQITARLVIRFRRLHRLSRWLCAAPQGNTPLTDPTNVRLRVVCPACGVEQPRYDTDLCHVCGRPLRVQP